MGARGITTIKLAKLSGVLGLLLMSVSPAQDNRPNIIFILTDDQRWDMVGAMGLNDVVQTPNMDVIANEGVMFENAYVTTSICMASRASIYTGQYQKRLADNGIVSFGGDLGAENVSRTMYTLLQNAGYYSGFVGKWHLAGNNRTGFDYSDTRWGNFDTEEDGEYIHLTAYMGNRVMDFLDQIPADQPFFLNMNTKAPHAQDQNPAPNQFPPDPALLPMYENDELPWPPTAEPEFYESLPDFLKGGETRNRWRLRFEDELYDDGVKDYYRLVTGIDIQLGRILDKLEEIGEADNTIIVFTGDNGMYLGERGYAGKWLSHEHSIRVPLIVYDPRAPEGHKGLRRKEIALNIDIAPTILSLAGVDIPVQMQGHDLTPLLNDESVPWRTDFLHEHPWTNGAIPRSEALVEARYKYIVYPQDGPNFVELYDVIEDPFEMNNLADIPEHQDKLDSMITRLDEIRTSTADDDEVVEVLKDSEVLNIHSPGFTGSKLTIRTGPSMIHLSGGKAGQKYQVTDIAGRVLHRGTLDYIGRAQFSLPRRGAGIFVVRSGNNSVTSASIY